LALQTLTKATFHPKIIGVFICNTEESVKYEYNLSPVQGFLSVRSGYLTHGGVQSPHPAPFSLYCYKSVFATKWIYASNGLYQLATDSFYATQRFSINHVLFQKFAPIL
jgi:hypothetical protein